MKSLWIALMVCAPVVAQASDPAAHAPAGTKEKPVCRSEDVTGSMFPRRVCHSKADWASLDGQRQDAFDAFRERGRITGTTGPSPH